MSSDKGFDGGLDAVLEATAEEASTGGPEGPAQAGPATVEMPVERLEPGRYQPRERLSEERLAELADSVREQGVLQPLVVRALRSEVTEAASAPRYEIVAGERRWRAAKLAGLTTVPVIVRALDDQAALAVALIENLQREDLNPIDQARSLSRLATEFELTHAEVAKAVGRSRAAVTNLVRLLELQDEVKDLLGQGELDMGHARALLSLEPERQVALARTTRKRGWSVRQVEEAVRKVLAAPADTPAQPDVELQTQWLQKQLARELDRKLAIRRNKDGSYTLQVGFSDLGELDETLERSRELVRRIRAAAGPRVREADGSG